MADSKTTKTPAKRPALKSATAKKAASKKTGAVAMSADPAPTGGTAEAKSRFNAALDEAKAGAAALRVEAEARAGDYRAQAKSRGDDLMSDAKVYTDKARNRAGELATDGKSAASDAIASLSRVVGDTAEQIDGRLGEQYGDYARSASRTLAETSAKLEAKSVDELGNDARDMVRKSPAAAIGIAAVAGFLIARLFRGSKD